MEDEGQVRERVSKALRLISRDLRRRSTSAEALLWEHLRDRRLDGIKCRRQNPIWGTTYVVDFYCRESLLAVELDGSVHDEAEQKSADVNRQHELEAAGIHILRFRNEQVFDDLNDVLSTILTTHLQRITATKPGDPSAGNPD